MSEPPPREKLLEAATRLFCRFGVNATGINAVLEEAGTAKLTLYNQFGSKDGLVAAVLEREGVRWRDGFDTFLADHGGPPREKLLGLFDFLAQWFAREDFYGCPFVNAVAEHDKLSPAVRAIAQAHRRAVFDRLVGLAAAAGAEAPQSLCAQLLLLKDGAIVAAMIDRRADAAAVARPVAEQLVDRHLGPAHSRAAGLAVEDADARALS